MWLKSVAKWLVKNTALRLLGRESCSRAFRALMYNRPPTANDPWMVRIGYALLVLAQQCGFSKHFLAGAGAAAAAVPTVVDEFDLHLRLNRIYDLPDVVVNSQEPPRVNVLVPAFAVTSISAGLFGVFNVAQFIASCGYRVRLVMFDNFAYDESSFRASLSKFPSFSNLFDSVEVEYIGDRVKPLQVSPRDQCVATVWYSAYFAEKIMNRLDGRRFLYLIQDHEAGFFAGNSSYVSAELTYQMHFDALISTQPLHDHLIARATIDPQQTNCIVFNNSCSTTLMAKDAFLARRHTRQRKFVFYCRPAVDRNMFELSTLAIMEAYRQGIFRQHDWELAGMGIGEVCIRLDKHKSISQLPRMTLKEYELQTQEFDLGLSLMASPHPSLVPFDLAGAGAIVVTNSFSTKTPAYFAAQSRNILTARPTLPALVEALTDAVERVEDYESRYLHAAMPFPSTWEEVWTAKHRQFIANLFGPAHRNSVTSHLPLAGVSSQKLVSSGVGLSS